MKTTAITAVMALAGTRQEPPEELTKEALQEGIDIIVSIATSLDVMARSLERIASCEQGKVFDVRTYES